jgi:hypothetical protein
MGIGSYRHYVTLARLPREGEAPIDVPLDPPAAWVQITPMTAGGEDHMLEYVVTLHWHPQINMETTLTFDDPVLLRRRRLMVRSCVNLDERRRTLQCQCYEVVP